MRRNIEICRKCKHLGFKYLQTDDMKPIDDEHNFLCWIPKMLKPDENPNWTFSDYDIPDECPYKLEHMVMK